MSITSYTDLQTAVTAWLARDGDSVMTARVPDFIQMCEFRIAYGSDDQMAPSAPLRIRAMETLVSLATVANQATVALPAGYLAMRRLQLVSTPNIVLNYRTPTQFDTEYNDDTSIGCPRVYTMEGDNLRFGPMPDSVYAINCLYYKKFDPLATAAGNTNWLLANAFPIYLYGTLLEAALFVQDDTNISRYAPRFSAAVNALQGQDTIDRHSGAEMVMRSDTQNP